MDDQSLTRRRMLGLLGSTSVAMPGPDPAYVDAMLVRNRRLFERARARGYAQPNRGGGVQQRGLGAAVRRVVAGVRKTEAAVRSGQHPVARIGDILDECGVG